ncbi:MAG: L,D-transpeptidase [Candidatus Aminicenantes bacterium]|nr:L,D-transpeptidase [Candidatus Aminicenantes bacterium]
MRLDQIIKTLLAFGLKKDETFIVICIDTQRLLIVENSRILKKYIISTSKYGTGNEKNSYKTPFGVHRIYKKIGDNVPLGGIFVGRKFTGRIARIPDSADLITTRILWLEGLEPNKNRGKNVDTRERYIYIHGTPEEDKIGIPSSKGCIRMKNKDIIELFKYVEEGTLLYILHQCFFLAEAELPDEEE